MDKKYKKMLTAFAAVPFLMVLGNSMLIPEFPKIKSALDINQFQVGLLITLFSASAGVAIPFLGYLSDRIGRKKIIIPSLLLYGLGGLIAGLAAAFLDENAYKVILVSRVIQGIGGAGTAPIVMALVGDIFTSNQRSEALGIIESANGLGKILSPILGATIALVSWSALFFSYAFLSIPIAASIWFLVEEPSDNIQKQSIGEYLNNIKQIFKKRGVSLSLSLLGGMIVLFLLFGVLSYLSDILETRYDIKGLTKGLVIAIPITFMSTTSYLTGLYLKKKGRYFKHALALGLIINAIILSLLPFIRNIYLYMGTISILGIGSGLILPTVNTLVTSSAPSEQRGGITSLYGSVRFIGVAFGPPTFSLLNRISEKAMFFGGASIGVLGSILIFMFLDESKIITDDNSDSDSDNSSSKN
ncbi:MFS transporter [Selenihalanaerobacter shriftii]|uniref:MFS transporter, ACDE family, multidrug resistance protein n=1 Tax=Selenihalanaerobacter shriftii TaxID=142842 RepID=A0A1T4P989_9FIRM|nr:MFS transporter [Selenihalanaerobacter shriftii]SJZ88140.1 MFS transporter, ACDE family, multidrug resistance protein [Selenihalanaerobacter shriftii]